jgi:Polyketide cyclase / dehydrase and lipid transport
MSQEIPASREATFDLLHDDERRLEWDTLLRKAYTVGGVPAGPGVEAVCQARLSLGGLRFRTVYVTYRRPELAAVKLVGRAPFFASWAASIRHEPLAAGRHELRYTLTFRCRPRLLAPVIEAVALAAFRWETRRRLRALARAMARGVA